MPTTPRPKLQRAKNTSQAFAEVTLLQANAPLTKTYALGDQGTPEKSKDPFLTEGSAIRCPIAVADFGQAFPELLSSLTTNQCIVLGAMSDRVDGEIADITTKSRHKPDESGDGSPIIWRGKDWQQYRDGRPAILGLDHDAKDLGPLDAAAIKDCGGLLAVLDLVCPALQQTASACRPSVSTGIEAEATGATTVGGGLHLYLMIADGGDARSFVERLDQHLLLKGWGYVYVSEAGSIFVRSIIDVAASGVGERLWFEAPAVLERGLRHIPDARRISCRHGLVLDTRAALPPLTPPQVVELEEIKRALRALVASEAEEKRQRYAESMRQIFIRRGEDGAFASIALDSLLEAEQHRILNGRHILYFDDGRVSSVFDVLSNRQSYHKATCSDPLEPSYGGGRNKAVVYTDEKFARLYTQAHGGRLYTLAYDERDIHLAMDAAKEDGQDGRAIVKRMLPDAPNVRSDFSESRTDRPGGSTSLTPYVNVVSSAGDARQDAAGNAVAVVPLDDDPEIDMMLRQYNERFAVVGEGGSVSVYRPAYNADLERCLPVSMQPDAFRLLHGNQYISKGRKRRDGEVEYEKVPTTKIWLQHEKRRTCQDGFGLDPRNKLPPSVYNLWQGFGVAPREGDWSRLTDLMLNVLAAGNESHFRYILNWLAHLVQFPDENPGVALVFRGEEGVGKGTLGKAIMRLIRPHAMQITNTKHLTGAFNAHLRGVLFLFADEAFFAGDRANEGVLKGLITEDYRVNEGKGRDATLGRNCIHLMMASNNEWVVPASSEARRFAVFDVSPIHRQQAEYFGPLHDEMDVDGDAAGISALLHYLLAFQVDKIMVRKAPETPGLHAQRIASLRGEPKWFFDVLTRGYVDEADQQTWPEVVTTNDLYASYEHWYKTTKESYPATRHAVGKFLKSLFQPYRPRGIGASKGDRPPSYRLGILADARRTFARKQNIGDPWADADEPADGN